MVAEPKRSYGEYTRLHSEKAKLHESQIGNSFSPYPRAPEHLFLTVFKAKLGEICAAVAAMHTLVINKHAWRDEAHRATSHNLPICVQLTVSVATHEEAALEVLFSLP